MACQKKKGGECRGTCPTGDDACGQECRVSSADESYRRFIDWNSDIKEVALVRLQQTIENFGTAIPKVLISRGKDAADGLKNYRVCTTSTASVKGISRSSRTRLCSVTPIAQELVQRIQEEPHTQKNKMQDFQYEITRIACDAGSVQQGGANTSCCGGAAGGISTVSEDPWNRRTQQPPSAIRSELGNMQACRTRG